jgi:hypothetical protein
LPAAATCPKAAGAGASGEFPNSGIREAARGVCEKPGKDGLFGAIREISGNWLFIEARPVATRRSRGPFYFRY